MIRSLEMAIATRYLRARRGSRLLSFISLIAIGGVVVGVSALTVVMAVMNGLQRDLREKILIGSPDLRLLTFGNEMSMPDWRATLDKVKKTNGVVAVSLKERTRLDALFARYGVGESEWKSAA